MTRASIREGKGSKDRLFHLGEWTARRLARYIRKVRPQLLLDINESTLFLNDYGEPFRDSKLGDRVKRYLKRAGIEAPGSCHLLRHAMATHMLENGAELLFIQAMLGHRDFGATEVYASVSIRKLLEVHAATHPARVEGRAAPLSSIAAEYEHDLSGPRS